MIFPGYNPFGAPQGKPNPPEDVPLHVFKAARKAGAEWLSTDGKRAYCKRYDQVFRADLTKNGFSSWWECDGLPGDAVEMP
jgi:hypothetical protein